MNIGAAPSRSPTFLHSMFFVAPLRLSPFVSCVLSTLLGNNVTRSREIHQNTKDLLRIPFYFDGFSKMFGKYLNIFRKIVFRTLKSSYLRAQTELGEPPHHKSFTKTYLAMIWHVSGGLRYRQLLHPASASFL